MSYEFLPGELYRMPTHFGPATGPRRGPEGRRFDCRTSPRTTAVALSYLSDADALARWLPPGFVLHGEPVVTVTATYMKEIQWLAGRGYNMLGVMFPTCFQGQRGSVPGQLLAVLWENMADPIMTGREELGYSKIFAELPEPIVLDGRTVCLASWQGYRFCELSVEGLEPMSAAEIKATAAAGAWSHGTLHYKYVPRTGVPGQADAAYATLTPTATPHRVVQAMWRGRGQLRFLHARWEDMPTQYMIVNALADLPLRELRAATVTHSVGGKDLSDMRILE